MNIKYVCEICESQFDSAVECYECEKQPPKRARFAKGEVIYVLSYWVLTKEKPFRSEIIKDIVKIGHHFGYVLSNTFKKRITSKEWSEPNPFRESYQILNHQDFLIGNYKRPALENEIYRIGDSVENFTVATDPSHIYTITKMQVTMETIDRDY
ncbi:MAG: hypothetical protein K1X72_04505 [Pyrinomonadaceae bacterium]|nr:hypothetical protein [Pyrinomonadaceae bacterium]